MDIEVKAPNSHSNKSKKSFEQIFNELERMEQEERENKGNEDKTVRNLKPVQNRMFRKKKQDSELLDQESSTQLKEDKVIENEDKGLISPAHAKQSMKQKLLQIETAERQALNDSASKSTNNSEKRKIRRRTDNNRPKEQGKIFNVTASSELCCSNNAGTSENQEKEE